MSSCKVLGPRASPTEVCGRPGEDKKAGFVQPEEERAERRPCCSLTLPCRKYRARLILGVHSGRMRGTKQKLYTRKSQLNISKQLSQGWCLLQGCAKLSQQRLMLTLNLVVLWVGIGPDSLF